MPAQANFTCSLILPLPRKRLSGCACHSPLAHFYIHHSESSIREIHPFTTITHLASKKSFLDNGEESINVEFLFRQSSAAPRTQPRQSSRHMLKKNMQWTNKLGALADEESLNNTVPSKGAPASPSTMSDHDATALAASSVKTTLRLEGPYFTPASPSSYRTVVCLVAGTGLSGAIAIAAAFAADRILVPDDARQLPTTATTCTMPAGRVGCWRRCVVVWTVREGDYTDMPFFDCKLFT